MNKARESFTQKVRRHANFCQNRAPQSLCAAQNVLGGARKTVLGGA